MLSRSIDLLVALVVFGSGCVLALNYPIGAFVASATFLSCTVLAYRQPSLFLILIPALLPVIGFYPWTGWISFEELDLLVLAAASGGYAKYAFERAPHSTRRISLLMTVLAGLMSISILVSMGRGFADAGGFVFGWFQGYDGPMNSLRIGKSFFLALLLIPLIARFESAPQANGSHKLATGVAIGLGTASLAALWERLAFTDLLDFSSDYRSTALFWEMHVGGAALDGWLLLTVPFSIWALRKSRSSLQLAVSLGLIALAAYASLTTFSRGVYVALIVSLPLLAWQTRRHAMQAGNAQPSWGLVCWTLALVLAGTMAALIFPTAGYRGLLALWGLVAVLLAMPSRLRQISPPQFFASVGAGLLLGAPLVFLANFLPKGPYVLYTLELALTFASLFWPVKSAANRRIVVPIASFVGLLLAGANVAGFWGGAEALPGMCGALLLLFGILAWGLFARQPLWPNDPRWQGGLLAAVLAVSGVIAVFVGGAYMEGRFSTSGKDFEGRLAHWKQSIGLLQTPGDVAFGKGLGRFPANYFFAIPGSAFPGTYQINKELGNASLALVGPRHPLSFGDVLRVSQRLSFGFQGAYEVDFKAKAKAGVVIHMEVCEKHLLYPAACNVGHATVKATNGEWQPAHIRLHGPPLSGGPWYAPRFKVFSLGIGDQSGTAEIDDIALSAFGGPNLLANASFTDEMQHWFISSDRDHLPWHAKNLLVNMLFDQGITGLVLFLLLTVCALWRLNVGRARYHELSPYLTAGIIGFLAVGMFDSLTDVPRLAFLYYLLILYSFSLKSPRHSQSIPGVLPSKGRAAERVRSQSGSAE